MAAPSIQPRVISKDYSDDPSLDFNELYQQGVSYIQALSGAEWTDYNLHDPGVTILEYLCFAITDLAYRTNFRIEDLLAEKDGTVDAEKNSFINRAAILSTAPVTPVDFRKLVLDEIAEVDNIWMAPVLSKFTSHHIHGRYTVTLKLREAYGQAAGDDKGREDTIVAQVRSLLNGARNLGEHFGDFIVLKPQPIQVTARVQVVGSHHVNDILARIYHQLNEYLNPHAHFYSEADLISLGKAPNDIFEGPLLKHGILPDWELKPLVTTIDPSALVRVISAVDGVHHVEQVSLEYNSTTYSNEPLDLEPGHYASLTFDEHRPDVTLYTGLIRHHHQPNIFLSQFHRLRQLNYKESGYIPSHQNIATKTLRGVYRNPGAYASFQKLMPGIYQLGQEEPDAGDPPARRGMVRQLKAYLVFFEQILANYLAQLEHLSDIFSPGIDGAQPFTYALQSVYDIPGIRHLLKAYADIAPGQSWTAFKRDPGNAYMAMLAEIAETDADFRTRKGKVLSHLLSRFNLAPDEFPAVRFNTDYGSGPPAGRMSKELEWKSRILTHILPFTRDRLKAPVYHKDGKAGYGFAFNMCLLLHIRHTEAGRRLSQVPGRLQQKKDHGTHHQPAAARLRTIDADGEPLSVDYSSDAASRTHFRFTGQPASFFSAGIDTRNYKIIPDPDHRNEHLILYRGHNEDAWKIVRRYPTEAAANSGLKNWMDALTGVNIDSEGFHIVEHPLLAPDKNTKVFGFDFYGNDGELLLRQQQLHSFAERDEVIGRLIETAMNDTTEAAIAALRSHCVAVTSGPGSTDRRAGSDTGRPHEEQQMASFLKAVEALRYFTSTARFAYPMFSYTVRRWDFRIIPERFFESQITVVLPSWPARFQNESFRNFLQATFREHLPAHMGLSFLWLGVGEMGRFEDVFFTWVASLQGTGNGARRMDAENLITYLLDRQKNL